MFKWFKKFMNAPYVEAVTDLEEFIKDSKISEPVYAIVKTFDEKGRWKAHKMFDYLSVNPYKSTYNFVFEDTVTGEKYDIRSKYSHWSFIGYHKQLAFPEGVLSHYLPSWMTQAEKDYVISEIEKRGKIFEERVNRIEDRKHKKSEAKAKVNQDKERQRLMKLYCKED